MTKGTKALIVFVVRFIAICGAIAVVYHNVTNTVQDAYAARRVARSMLAWP